jgi:perosamine synthetase
MTAPDINIPLSRPDITDLEIEQVTAVLRTPYLSLGPKLPEFENLIAEYVGVRHAVAVNSGTSALHLIIRSLGIGEGDEVITTPFSFIASANCILLERARPVFVDIDPTTLNLNTDLIAEKITEKTRAILAVDVFGLPADWDALKLIADKHKLILIEDSCEALGADYKGRKAGSLGIAGAFGFYPNKQITTGEGGVVVTDDERIARLCRSMRNQGRDDSGGWFDYARPGYNFRLSDINCALGIAQLSRLQEILVKREHVATLYNSKLSGLAQVITPALTPNVKRSWFVYVAILKDKPYTMNRDAIVEELRRRGIGCAKYFVPIHLQPFYMEMYGYKQGDFPVTESISQRTIALPFYTSMTEADIDTVVQQLKDIIGQS